MKISAFKASNSHMRIADVLLTEEEEEEVEAEGGVGFPVMGGCSGRRGGGDGGCVGIVSRILSRLRRAKAKRVSVENARCTTNLPNGADLVYTAGPESDRSGECRREASFNLGIGCYLLRLIASSQNELDKMTELRTQMETLLRNVKEELKMKDTLVNPSESVDIHAYSTTDIIEGLESNDHNSLLNRTTSHVSSGSSTIKVHDQSLMCDWPKPGGMERLEAELEAELEHLQLHLDKEKLMQYTEQEREEETVMDTAYVSQSSSFGEVIDPVIDPREACPEVECGVPPYELERRLHEVLEARQQEQISELEAALECAKYKLHEKEKVQNPAEKKNISVHVKEEFFFTTESLDMKKAEFTLDSVRDSLIRQEDTIVFCLIERAKYPLNSPAYNQSYVPGFSGSSLVEHIVKQTETLQATAGRYENPEEHAFFPDNLPRSLVPSYNYSQVLHTAANSININKMIWDKYYNQLLPLFVAEGDDGNYASTASSDIDCLQALSRRIHYGKFVAEVKFRDAPHDYEPAIRAKDKDALMKLLTFEKVEEMVRRRVEKKAMVFGQEVNLDNDNSKGKYKVDPSVVSRLYVEWVMPLTKLVQVEYLLRRLD
ncbi:hypothetical protein LWI28_012480 [Acer negundo]|uniref:chorismate mutase n=1 Tax=Acer negundo TaxID=4023 RepID=A0AAD5P0J4_ACENE|nr:hypothetical protein LWI28_012480 [Acer negundo]